jgi:2-dehydropantoate 2-reductase
MRIVVFGAGGVGGYFGGRLAHAGEDVTFIARGKHLDALQTQGLRVSRIYGDFIVSPIHVTHDPSTVGIADVILLAVKAWQVSDAIKLMRPMVGPDTFIVPLLNGVEAPAQLSAVLGPESILGGLCWIISFISEPGVIHHIGMEPHVIFGELDNRRSQRVERLYQAFVHADVNVEIPQDTMVAMWEKFVYIASISGMGSVTRVPVGIMRSLPQTRQMIEHAVDEIIAVGWELEIRLPDNLFQQTMHYIDSMPADSTLSMQRDIMSGRPSELEAQSGAVVRLGKDVNVTTPINTFVYQSLLPLELRARGQV